MSRFLSIIICLILTALIIDAVPFEAAHVKVLKGKSQHATTSTTSFTRGGDEDAPFSIILEIMTSSKYFKLILRLSTNIFSPYYEEVVHDSSLNMIGSSSEWKRLQNHPDVQESRCLYDGKVQDDPNSVVSINACHGTLHGMIVLGNGEQYSIEDHPNTLKAQRTGQRALQTGEWGTLSQSYHVSLVNVSEERKSLKNDPGVCLEQQTPGRLATALMNKAKTIESSPVHVLQDDTGSGGNRYVEIVLYHDYARCASFNTTQGLPNDSIISLARANGLELFHNMAAYYKHGSFSHDIQLVLKGHVFFLNGDPYQKLVLSNGQIRVTGNRGLLSVFNTYRTRYGHYNHDVGILLSGASFQDNIRGLANVASGCSSTAYNGNINQVTYRNAVMNSVLITHELGHCLSAMHDDVSGYIMSPYVSTSVVFSPRSKRAINNFMSNTQCLINTSGAAMIDSINSVDDEDHDPLTDPLYMRSAAMKEKRRSSPIYLYDLEDQSTFSLWKGGEQPQEFIPTRSEKGRYTTKDFAFALSLTALTSIAATSLLSWALFRYLTKDSPEKSKYDELQKKYTHLVELYNQKVAEEYPQSPNRSSYRAQAPVPSLGLTIQSPNQLSPQGDHSIGGIKQPHYPDLPSPQDHRTQYQEEIESPHQR